MSILSPLSLDLIHVPRSRIQKASKEPGETALSRFTKVTVNMFKEEGPAAFYKGILPRVMRVAPGQAIVFTVSPDGCASSALGTDDLCEGV